MLFSFPARIAIDFDNSGDIMAKKTPSKTPPKRSQRWRRAMPTSWAELSICLMLLGEHQLAR